MWCMQGITHITMHISGLEGDVISCYNDRSSRNRFRWLDDLRLHNWYLKVCWKWRLIWVVMLSCRWFVARYFNSWRGWENSFAINRTFRVDNFRRNILILQPLFVLTAVKNIIFSSLGYDNSYKHINKHIDKYQIVISLTHFHLVCQVCVLWILFYISHMA